MVSPSRNVIGVGNTQSLLGACARTWGHKQELPWKSTFQVETDTLIYEETLPRLSAAQIIKKNIRAMHSLVSMTEQILEESYYPIRRNFEPKYEIRLTYYTDENKSRQHDGVSLFEMSGYENTQLC